MRVNAFVWLHKCKHKSTKTLNHRTHRHRYKKIYHLPTIIDNLKQKWHFIYLLEYLCLCKHATMEHTTYKYT